MIVDRQRRPPQQPSIQVTLPMKGLGEEQLRKVPTIHRHYSEDDFKKHIYTQQVVHEEVQTRAEEEYYGSNSPVRPKHVYSREKSGKRRSKLNNREKPFFEGMNRNSGLKETSSTQSA